MNPIPPHIAATIPAMNWQDEAQELIAYVKLFTPWAKWTWWICEWDGENECFGFVEGHEKELGYFHLAELAECKGPFGLTIERDIHFKPGPLSLVSSYKSRRISTEELEKSGKIIQKWVEEMSDDELAEELKGVNI